MAKLFYYASALLVAASAFSAYAQNDPKTVNQPSCEAVNFEDSVADFIAINNILGLANSGLLKNQLGKFDPLVINDKVLSPVPVSALGVNFEVSLTIQSVRASGFSDLYLKNMNVTSSSSLALGGKIKDEIQVISTVKLFVKQLNHKWFVPCWTNPLHPFDCPGKDIGIDLAVSLTKPEIDVNLLVAMLKCPPSASECKNLTVTDLLIAAMNQKFDEIMKRVFLRMKEVSVLSFNFSFDRLNNIKLHFDSSGYLVTAIGDKIFDFFKNEMNDKGDIYRAAVRIINKLAASAANNAIKEKLAPMFGAGCLDA